MSASSSRKYCVGNHAQANHSVDVEPVADSLSEEEEAIEALGFGLGFPPEMTAQDLRDFLLERWEVQGTKSGRSADGRMLKPKTQSPGRRLYKLQRALHVEDVWLVEDASAEGRLRAKQELLTFIKRLVEHGLPELERTEEGQFVDDMKCRRHLALKDMAKNLTVETLIENKSSPQPSKARRGRQAAVDRERTRRKYWQERDAPK